MLRHFFVALLLMAPAPALAYDLSRPWSAGLVTGLYLPTSTSQSSRFGFGTQVDYRFFSGIELGAFFQTSSETVATITARMSFLGLEGMYRLDSVLDGLIIGARAGAALSEFTGLSPRTSFVYGPIVGVDADIVGPVSAGALIDVFFNSGGSGLSLDLFVTLRYHFSI